MKKNIILLGSLILSSVAYSQVGIDTQEPKATLDVVVKSDKLNKPFGIIAPRVTGIELRNAGGQFNADQDGAIVYATSSAETTTGRAKNVTQRGYYYYDATLDNGSSLGLWVALKNAPADYVEPWNQAGTTTPATANNQPIYQNGAVSIWRNKVFESTASGSAKVDLHVNGATRVGGQDPDVAKSVGGNSFAGGNAPVASGNNAMAYGTSVEASGTNSAAFGNNSKAVGTESIAMGNNTTATGAQSFAGGGNGSTATGQYAFAFGNNAQAKANHAVAMGVGTVAPARSSVTLGRYNVNTFPTSDITQNSPGDPIFQVGSGPDDARRYNIITTFLGTNGTTGVGGGWMAIGGDLNTMPVKVQDETLRVYGGALANKAYVTDINSVAGATTDKVVVADGTTGQLKTISATGASVAYKEPWNIQNSTTPSASNEDAIYQNAAVAVKKQTGITGADLDIAGAIRGGGAKSTTVGTNSLAMGTDSEATGSHSVAMGNGAKSTHKNSIAMGNGAQASGNGNVMSVAVGPNAIANYGGSYAFGNRAKTGFAADGITASASNHAYAFGEEAITGGNNAYAFGRKTKAVGSQSFAFGDGAQATGTRSFAYGTDTTISSGQTSFAIGETSTASERVAFAGGNGSNATKFASFAYGFSSNATAERTVAMGNQVSATGYAATAFGDNTLSSGPASFAAGYKTTASGSGSFAISNNSKATGASSFAGGGLNGVNAPLASGDQSFAWGYTANAVGTTSFALGNEVTANGTGSAVLGWRNTVNNSAEFAAGQYSIDDTDGDGTIFKIGTGLDPVSRYNGITVFRKNYTDGYNTFVAIGSTANTLPSRVGSEALRVYGGVNANSYAVGATTLTVPDYVFQKYYTGTSTLKGDYKFTSNLYEVENFLRQNHHLPGVTSAKEIAQKGFYNLEDLQMQSLEKTEELYLHVIEQQKQIDELKELVKTQQAQINQLLAK